LEKFFSNKNLSNSPKYKALIIPNVGIKICSIKLRAVAYLYMDFKGITPHPETESKSEGKTSKD
jgi:hypothetical protein